MLMALEHPKQQSARAYLPIALSIIAVILALLALLGKSQSPIGNNPPNTPSSLEQTKRGRKLRVGYGPFPPYTIIDPNQSDPSKQVSGLCVDMINEIASRQTPPWQVEWHKVSWEALRADMYSDKFDVLASAIYETVPRASEFQFTEPFTYVGVGVAVVRKDEDRIRVFDDLNKPGITVSLAEGWTATEYARRHLNAERLLVKPVGDDVNAQFNDLLGHRADAVLQDVPTALSYQQAHSNEVKILWLDNPPMRVAAGFITRWEDRDMIIFLNTAIRTLQEDGTIELLDRKWKGMGEYPAPNFKPGAGLPQSK
jgi:polar amino acid transport system substrate-binding protein